MTDPTEKAAAIVLLQLERLHRCPTPQQFEAVRVAKDAYILAVEGALIETALRAEHGHVIKSAELLGLTERHLHRLLRVHPQLDALATRLREAK